MKFSTFASALAVAAPAFAAPTAVEPRQDIDVTVLQFALTLEHLENYFYSHALRRLRTSDFVALGFDRSYFTLLRYIASDEKSHVQLLTDAIAATGATPVKECKYNFNENMTAAEFITLSSVLEGVGTSAYLGGAPLITSKDYLTVAGSILVTEALHTSLQRNAAKEVPFATPYGTPLDPNSVYTLAASFITSCPSSADSTKLGFVAYPALTAVPGGAISPGTVVSFTADSIPAGSYLTFVSGLAVTSVPATITGNTASAAVPTGSGGQVYVLLTTVAATGNSLASAGTPAAGPAIIEVTPAPPCFLGIPSCGVA